MDTFLEEDEHEVENVQRKVTPFLAVFTDTLDSIRVLFNYELAPQLYVPCEEIFSTETLNILGKDPNCQLINSEISITLGYGSTILPSNSLEFIANNSIRAIAKKLDYKEIDANEDMFNIEGNITIDNAQNPSPPYLLIYGPTQICTENFSLKVINFSGHSNKLNLYWQVTSEPENDDDNRKIETILANNNNVGEIKLNLSMFQLNTIYTIKVGAENRFGIRSATDYIHSLIHVNKSFTVNIHGNQHIDPSVENIFTASIIDCSLSKWISEVDEHLYTFKWSIEPNDIELSDLSTIRIVIPNRKLYGGVSYILSVEATNHVTKISDKHSLILITALENLKPIVNTNGLIKGTTGEYIFDAKLSYDPSNTKDKLNFLWNCKSENYSSFCENIISRNKYFSIPSRSLLPGKYLFNMTISKSNRKSWVEIPLTIINDSLPTIYIDYNYNNYRYKFNIDEEIIINAYITSDYDVNVKWESVKSKYVEIINLDLVESIIGNTKWNLIKPNRKRVSLILPPADKYIKRWIGLKGETSYRFSLKASSLDGKRIALCDILIPTNEPPKGGSIKIIPDEGIAMKTLFNIDLGTWVDVYSDCPLSYEIFYSYPNEFTPTMITTIYSSEPSFVTVLPGSCYNTTELIIATRVCDKYKSCTVKRSIVKILASNLSFDDIYYFSNKTWKFLNKGYLNEAIFQARSMLQTLNQCDLDDWSLIHQISSLFQNIIVKISERLIKEYELKIKTHETQRQFVNLIYSVGTLSTKLLRSSTINQLIKLRLICLESLTSEEMIKNSRQKSYVRRFKRTFHSFKILPFIPLKIHEVYTFLLLDELIFKYESSFKKAYQVLDNINYYLSDLCLELGTFSTDADIGTNLFELRAERIIIDENDTNFIPIASKSREEIGGYIQLSKNLFDQLKKWRCTAGIPCQELCLVSAEITTKIAVKLNSSFQGPLVKIDFVNPENGDKLTVKKLKEPVIFPLPLEPKKNMMTGSLRCALYDELDHSVSLQDCQTLSSSTSYLLCSCQSLGYHGAVNKNKLSTMIPTSEKNNTKSTRITTESTILPLNITLFNYYTSNKFNGTTKTNVREPELSTYSPFFKYSTQPSNHSIYTDDFNGPEKYTAPNLNKNLDNINNFSLTTTSKLFTLTDSLLTKYFDYNKTSKSSFDSYNFFDTDSVTTSSLYSSLVPRLSTIFDEHSTSLMENLTPITLFNFSTIKYGKENKLPVISITEIYTANSTDESISIKTSTAKISNTNSTINSANKQLTEITSTQIFSEDNLLTTESTTALNNYDANILNNFDTLPPEEFPITDNDYYYISTLSITSLPNISETENISIQKEFWNDKPVIILKIILDGNFDEYIASVDEKTAINHTLYHLAYVLKVSEDIFLNIKLEKGSIIINCVINKTVIDNIDDITNKLNKLKYLNGINGDTFLVKNYIIKGESTSIKNDNDVNVSTNQKSTSATNSTQKLTTRSLKNENEKTSSMFSEASTLSFTELSTLPSKEIDESFMMKLSFIADEDYNREFVGKEKEFIDNLVKELSEQLNLPMESFQNVQVLNGMKIELEIYSGPNATVQMVKDSHAYFTNLISKGNAFIKGSEGNLIKLYDSTTNLRTTFSTESSKEDSTASTLFNSKEKKEIYSYYIYIGSAIVVILVLITLFLAYKTYIQKKYHRKVLPEGLRRLSSKDSSKSDSRIELISPLGGTLLRRYSYDSGVWINGENDQIKNFAPKPAVYSPPNERQIISTPRPPSVLIRKDYKMRHDYPIE